MFLDRTRFVDDRAFFLVLRSLERDASDIISFQRAIFAITHTLILHLVLYNFFSKYQQTLYSKEHVLHKIVDSFYQINVNLVAELSHKNCILRRKSTQVFILLINIDKIEVDPFAWFS